MTGVGDLVVIAATSGIITLAVRRSDQRKTTTGGGGRSAGGKKRAGGPGQGRRSLLVTFYNNAATEPVTAQTPGQAAAELAGRRAGRSWRTATAAAGRRWEYRSSARPPESVADRWRKAAAEQAPRFTGWSGRRWRSLKGWSGWRWRPGARTGRDPEPPPDPLKPSPPPPDPHRRAPDPESKGPEMSTDTETGETTSTGGGFGGSAPSMSWTLLLTGVAAFSPEDDADLVRFMAQEAAGVVAYAEALEQARENCTNEVGLDPTAVQGLTTYSEHMSEAALRMAEAHRQFMAVYGEVLELAASGVVLPHNGRWFTGNTS